MQEIKLLKDVILSNFNLNKYPYKLTFAITYMCNYKCKHCSIWKRKPSNELSLDEIELFVKNYNHFKWFNLTGGEPFLRKDLIDIVQTLKENSKTPLLFNTTTNGFNPDLIYSKVEEMLSLRIPLTVVVVSLDGYKQLHEYVRGVKGSFNNALKTFELLKELMKENKRFKTFLGYTVNPLNIGQFKRTFIEVKKRMKVVSLRDFHFNIYHTSTHYYGNLNMSNEFDEYREKLLDELKLINSFKKINPLNLISFLEKGYVKLAMKYVKNNKTPLPCKAIQSSIFIDPMGNVFPCTIFEYKLGNLRNFEYDLKKILNQKKTMEKKRLVKLLRCPNCWTPCEAYQSILGNMGRLICHLHINV